MVAPLAALLSGPLIRLIVLIGVVVALITFVDIGSIDQLINGIITDLESLVVDGLLGGLLP